MVLLPYLVRAGLNRAVPYLLRRNYLGLFPGAARQVYRTKQLAYAGGAAIAGSVGYGTYSGIKRMGIKRGRSGRRIPASLEGGFRYPPWQRSGVKTELDRPLRTEGAGHVSLGKNVTYTKTSRNVNIGSYGRPNTDAVKSITWRWQSIANLPTSVNPEYPQDNPRSLDLSVVRTDAISAGQSISGMYLPVYAFDLGTQPGQGIYGTTKTGHNLQSIPMYRLRKNYTNGTALSTSVDNYVWKPVCGFQNYQYNATGAYSPYWNQEIKDVDPQGFSQVKRCWNDIEILFQCNRTMDCKIHVAVVKFDRFCGPRRQYTAADTALTVTNSSSAVPTLLSYDETVSGNDRYGVDTFWESYFDKKFSHPLSQYNQQNKTRRLRFISHETIDCHPDANVPATAATTTTEYMPDGVTVSHRLTSSESSKQYSGNTYVHKKKLFVRGGKWINCASNVASDQQFARGTLTYGQQPPVYDQFAGSVDTGFNRAYGFNVIDRTVNTVNLVDDYSAKHEDGNPWLLIWMECPMSFNPRPGPYSDDSYNWPPDYDWNVSNNQGCCSFDIKVRSKMKYCQPQQQVNLSTGAVTALGTVA